MMYTRIYIYIMKDVILIGTYSGLFRQHLRAQEEKSDRLSEVPQPLLPDHLSHQLLFAWGIDPLAR